MIRKPCFIFHISLQLYEITNLGIKRHGCVLVPFLLLKIKHDKATCLIELMSGFNLTLGSREIQDHCESDLETSVKHGN